MKKLILGKMIALMTAAFGLVAALAWNGAIQAAFKEIFGEASSLWAMFSYAVVVTIIAVLVIYLMSKAEAKIKK